MARIPRITLEGLPHHVTQRGNRKQAVFQDDEDRVDYLHLLARCMRTYDVRVWAYALMSNHVHLLCVPATCQGLSDALRDLHGDYAARFNVRHGESGHLWQARFNSTALDDQHLANATRYVERNPVRAGMVAAAEHYRWSSAPAHCGLRDDPVLSPDLPLLSAISDWRAWLSTEDHPDQQEVLRERTRTGRPLISDELLRVLERPFARSLVPKAAAADRPRFAASDGMPPSFL